LNERSGEILWENRDFGLGWWCGIEGVSSSVLFLHGFASPDLPIHRSVHAIDIARGEVLWSTKELRFSFATPDAVFAAEDALGGTIIFELDPRTGSRRRSWTDGDDPAAVPRPREDEHDAPEFPAPLGVVEQEQPAAVASIRRAFPRAGTSSEVLVKGNLVVAGCTTASEENGPGEPIRSAILVLRRAGGEILYREDLTGAGGSGGPLSFFVREGILVYVRERTILTGVDLSPAQIDTMEGTTR
jgi:hypothetical protein